VFLDIPESTAGDEQTPATLPTAPAVVRDTLRPPIESVLQSDSVLQLLPKASDGAIDWTMAVNSGTIDPQDGPDAPEVGSAPSGFAYDFYFGEFETYFPHSAHVEVMDCAGCHPAIYRQRGGKTSMSEIMGGSSCGKCHGKVAFTVNACERCHPASTMPEGRLKAELKDDVVMIRDTSSQNAAAMGDLALSVFPHWTHRIRYRCNACHPASFEMTTGERVLTMADMQGGKTCGSCHVGSTAFGLMECARCHRAPATVPAPED
jgi:c(7)-type cytochrome triheme protein